MALKDGLVSYWEFEDLTDSHGSNDLTNVGGTTTSSGKIGDAYEFDGSSHYMYAPTDSSLDLTSTYTLAGWLYLPSLVSGVFISKGASASEYPHYNITVTSAGGIQSYGGNGGNTRVVSDTGLLSTGWNFIAVVHEGTGSGEHKIYVDGSLETSGTLGNATATTEPLNFNLWRTPSYNDMACTIDEIGIWNTAKTASEISQLYNSGDGMSYSAINIPSAANYLKGRQRDRFLMFNISEKVQ